MGVTTVVAGNCGGSADDIAGALARIEQTGVAVNYATLYGHNTVRRAVMGTERRAPDASSLSGCRRSFARRCPTVPSDSRRLAMPARRTYAEPAEIVALATVAGRAGGLPPATCATRCRAGKRRDRNARRRRGGAVSGRDLTSEGRCAKPMGRQRQGACADRWRARERPEGQCRCVSLRRGELHARHPLRRGSSKAVRTRSASGSPTSRRLRIKEEMKKLIRERGLENYSFARIASYRADPALNGLTIPEVARRWLGSNDLEAQLKNDAADASRRRRIDGLSVHVRR